MANGVLDERVDRCMIDKTIASRVDWIDGQALSKMKVSSPGGSRRGAQEGDWAC